MADITSSDLGRNWADMPMDLLDLILKKLVLLPDFIRFGAVCKNWLSVVLGQKPLRYHQQQPPMLLIPAEDGSKRHRNLYSIWEDKVYPCRFQIPYSIKCSGSSYGWWAFAEQDLSITLLNPFYRKMIRLPPFMKTPLLYISDNISRIHTDFLMRKVILSCDPYLYPHDYVVAVIYYDDQMVAFIRSDQQCWTRVGNNFYGARDILFHKGQLLAVDCHNELVAINYSDSPISCNLLKDKLLAWDLSLNDYDDELVMSETSYPPPLTPEYCGSDLSSLDEEELEEDRKLSEDHDLSVGRCDEYPVEYLVPQTATDYLDSRYVEYSMGSYLVESLEGDLLLVRRVYLDVTGDYDFNDEVTVGFKVYKLDKKKAEWVEINSLDNFALFLGDNSSICIRADSFPNCQSNSIYYMHDCSPRDPLAPHAAVDMGFFNLENGQLGKHYLVPDSLKHKPAAVWVLPTLV